MKPILFLTLISLTVVFMVVLVVSKFLINQDQIPLIEGTYIRYSVHEFGSEWDTLTIKLQNGSANEYSIVRKWKYERVLDGVSIKPEYKRCVSSGLLNKKEKRLIQSGSGESYTFNDREDLLFTGSTKYQKIK